MTRAAGTLAVIAKAPVPGRSKTRLSPPYTPGQAAQLATAALADTLAAMASTPARRRVVVLDGTPGGWLPPGVEVIPQRGGNLAERLASAFADLGGPAVVIGMDTPQLTPWLLTAALEALERSDAVFGPATDGGYWAIGLRRADPAVFSGVPMSRPDTGAAQLSRLRALGLRTAHLPALRDVDDVDDARAVAALAPHTRFSTEFARIAARIDIRREVAA